VLVYQPIVQPPLLRFPIGLPKHRILPGGWMGAVFVPTSIHFSHER
jgi:hypothetical protein